MQARHSGRFWIELPIDFYPKMPTGGPLGKRRLLLRELDWLLGARMDFGME